MIHFTSNAKMQLITIITNADFVKKQSEQKCLGYLIFVHIRM